MTMEQIVLSTHDRQLLDALPGSDGPGFTAWEISRIVTGGVAATKAIRYRLQVLSQRGLVVMTHRIGDPETIAVPCRYTRA